MTFQQQTYEPLLTLWQRQHLTPAGQTGSSSWGWCTSFSAAEWRPSRMQRQGSHHSTFQCLQPRACCGDMTVPAHSVLLSHVPSVESKEIINRPLIQQVYLYSAFAGAYGSLAGHL